MPPEKLAEYLRGAVGPGVKPNETPGLDNSVVKTKYPGLYQISTTDFFYPLVEDPYLQGRIAACNVLSDLYAMAVTEVDTMLMLIAASSDMAAAERDTVTTLMMKGFTDTATEAGTSVTGGQTVLNPWPIIGGVALSLRHESEFVRPGGLLPGDVLVLTKPLGTQVAVNLWQWRDGGSTPSHAKRWAQVSTEEGSLKLTAGDAAKAYNTACESMSRLNLHAAQRMIKHGAHGATDVTGFGILGHAGNLAQYNDAAEVTLVIHTLPVIAGAAAVDDAVGRIFKLRAGRSAETSGGLLVALPSREAAQAFIDDVAAADGRPAWIVGEVVPRVAAPPTADGTPGEPIYSIVKDDAAIINV